MTFLVIEDMLQNFLGSVAFSITYTKISALYCLEPSSSALWSLANIYGTSLPMCIFCNALTIGSPQELLNARLAFRRFLSRTQRASGLPHEVYRSPSYCTFQIVLRIG